MEHILDWHTLLVFVLVLLGILLYQSTLLPNGFPNGPRPLPIVGNILHLLGNPKTVLKNLMDLSKQYGPMVGLKFGSVPLVLLNDIDSIKEVLMTHSDSFTARPENLYMITKLARNPPNGPVRGVTVPNGEAWKKSRRFALSTMRDFGFGKKSIEAKIQEEVAVICNEFSSSLGKPCNPHKLLQKSVSNIICNICFGSRFEYNDPAFIELLVVLNEGFQIEVVKSATNFFPFLRFLPTHGVYKKLGYSVKHVDDWIAKQIDNHRETYDPKDMRDFVDVYLSKESEVHDEIYSPYNVRRIIFDLFVAGTETTSTALRWFLLYMIYNPDVQNKAKQEIDSILGQGRVVRLEDRKNMPYMDAVLHETLRVCNILGLALPHSAVKDVTVKGFRIPKDTLILPNTEAVHMDNKVWDKPEEFRPERWIGEDGKFQRKEAFLAFSVGPRSCLGESLAQNEMFLFATTLMQRFNILICDPSNPPPLQGTVGIVHAPVEFDIIFETR